MQVAKPSASALPAGSGPRPRRTDECPPALARARADADAARAGAGRAEDQHERDPATTVDSVLDAMTDEQLEIAARHLLAQVVGEEIRRYRLRAKR